MKRETFCSFTITFFFCVFIRLFFDWWDFLQLSYLSFFEWKKSENGGKEIPYVLYLDPLQSLHPCIYTSSILNKKSKRVKRNARRSTRGPKGMRHDRDTRRCKRPNIFMLRILRFHNKIVIIKTKNFSKETDTLQRVLAHKSASGQHQAESLFFR